MQHIGHNVFRDPQEDIKSDCHRCLIPYVTMIIFYIQVVPSGIEQRGFELVSDFYVDSRANSKILLCLHSTII